MIPILFTRENSIYNLLECDPWPKSRNALLWPGNSAFVAHPPCGQWGRLRKQAINNPAVKDLAIWTVKQLRVWGGVMEHPAGSNLWDHMQIKKSTSPDQYNGFTISIDQFWFGHKARKRTWLYIVGCTLADLPPLPLNFSAITHHVSTSLRKERKYHSMKELSKAGREATPIDFAKWLIEVATTINTIQKEKP